MSSGQCLILLPEKQEQNLGRIWPNFWPSVLTSTEPTIPRAMQLGSEGRIAADTKQETGN